MAQGERVKLQLNDHGPVFDGEVFKPLPSTYYDLTCRVVRLLDVQAEIERSDPLWKKAQFKLDMLMTEIQAIIDQTLGSAKCPRCHGMTITPETVRTRQPVRICIRHDLTILRIQQGTRYVPGAGNV